MQPQFEMTHLAPARTPHAAIRVGRSYDAAPARVFAAWVEPALACRWLFATASRPMTHAEIDPRVGGRYRLVENRYGRSIEHCGEYAVVVPARRLAFTLSSPDVPEAITHVRADFLPLAGGCAVTLWHAGLPARHVRQARARWTGILYGLGATLGVRHGAARAAPSPFLPPRITEKSHAIPADVLFR